MRKVVAVALLLGVAGMIPTMLKALTDSMLFHPERGQHTTPAAAGVAFEDLRVTGDDGVRTQAWWIPAARTGPGVTVLFFHGNAGTIADRLPRYVDLQRRGISVLAAEYRGYGDSAGAPSEAGLLGDGRAALREAIARAGDDKIVVAGRSLGGAVAIQTAASAPPGSVAGLWVESTFTSLAAMAARSGIPMGARLVAYSFDSIGVITEVDVPVLVLHGDRDDLIPVAMGRALADAVTAAGGDATFVSLPGADHNTTPPAAAAAHRAAVNAFLERVR